MPGSGASVPAAYPIQPLRVSRDGEEYRALLSHQTFFILPVSDLLERVRLDSDVPRHVAVIMDGNGRWARERGMPREFGHRAGMSAVRETVEGAIETGIEVLTLFAFSQENWQRPPAEVSALMGLLELYVRRERNELREKGVGVHVLGNLDRLGPRTRAAIEDVIQHTRGQTRLHLNLAISYGARAELVRAARRLAEQARGGMLAPEDIDEEVFAAELYTAHLPDPDLLIRTSGESRISNFLLWQIAYTELHICSVRWPDFTRQHLFAAVHDYQNRERRFGRVLAS